MFKKIGMVAGAALVVAVVALPRTARTAGPVTTGVGSCHAVTEANKPSGTVVSCPTGEKVTGGGGRCYGFGGNWESWMVGSYPSGQGWAVTCENVKSGAKQTVGETYAICCAP